MTDLYDIGDRPPLGVVPQRMHAYAVRQNRFGQPRDAWQREVILSCSAAATAYRMLMGWHPNVIDPGDVVLVWGAAGAARTRRRSLEAAGGTRVV